MTMYCYITVPKRIMGLSDNTIYSSFRISKTERILRDFLLCTETYWRVLFFVGSQLPFRRDVSAVEFQRTALRYIPEDRTFYNHRCENIEPCIDMLAQNCSRTYRVLRSVWHSRCAEYTGGKLLPRNCPVVKTTAAGQTKKCSVY
jgi:hypothetical protein